MQEEIPVDQTPTTTTEWIRTINDPPQCITHISLLGHDTDIRETGIQKRPGRITPQRNICTGTPDTKWSILIIRGNLS